MGLLGVVCVLSLIGVVGVHDLDGGSHQEAVNFLQICYQQQLHSTNTPTYHMNMVLSFVSYKNTHQYQYFLFISNQLYLKKYNYYYGITITEFISRPFHNTLFSGLFFFGGGFRREWGRCLYHHFPGCRSFKHGQFESDSVFSHLHKLYFHCGNPGIKG